MALSDAEKKLAGIQADRGAVAREGRLADYMGDMNDELDRQHQARMGARARRLESALAAGADGGRYSPITMDRMRGELEYIRGRGITGLRQHELDVADKNIEQERVKAWGMANQGGVAAGIRAGVDRELGRAQHGYFDENGNYVPGSTVNAAYETGLSREEIAMINNEGRWNVANANNETRKTIADSTNQTRRDISDSTNQTRKDISDSTNQTRKEVGAGHDLVRRDAAAAQQQRADQRGFESWIQKELGTNPMNWSMSSEEREMLREMSVEEQKAFYMKKFGRTPSGTQGAPAKRSWRDRYQPAQ